MTDQFELPATTSTGQVMLHAGDCLEVIRTLPDCSVDAVVTDPPYGLEFMGTEWDSFKPSSARIRTRVDSRTNPTAGKSVTATPEAYVAGAVFQRWCETWAAECLRVLKPGGHLLAFGSSRTWHRLACAIEDAGFELRDSIAWLYGSGFPKSLNLPDGRGTALKPAFEPIVVARKLLAGTVAQNVTEHGTGALNVDKCRIVGRERTEYGLAKATRTRVATYGMPSESADFDASKGRWPANVVLDEAAAAELDRQTAGTRASKPSRSGTAGEPDSGSIYNSPARVERVKYADAGGASRFFYTPKASKNERPEVDGVRHPTVKPVELMRWLVRLVTPPGGTVLDPFAGSGTTAEACVLEHLRCIAIEREPTYLPLIESRLARHGAFADR